MKKENINFKRLMTFAITAIMCMTTLAVLPTVSADIPTNMVAYWNFDDGIGSTILDETTNAHDGTLSGGKFGNALEFDGYNDYVEVNCESGSSLNLLNAVTIEAWVKSTTAGSYDYVIAKYYDGGKASYALDTDSAKLRFYVTTGGSYHQVTSNQNLWDDDWHHIAGSYDKDAATDNIKLYIDNNLVSSGTTTGTMDVNSNMNFYIGNYGTSNRFSFPGKIDEVRVSNFARPNFDYEQTHAPIDDGGTVGLWHFDESVDTTVYDETSNDNDGTIYGASWAGPEWVDGIVNKALEFDGVDDCVILDDNEFSDEELDEYTFEAWIYIESLDSVQRRIFDDEGGLRPMLTSGNKLAAFHWDSTTWNGKTITGSTTPTTSTWYHIAQTYNGSDLKFYIDGVLVGTISCNAWEPDGLNRDVNLGTWWQGLGRNWKGLIDEVRIYDCALSADVINAHANLNYNPPVANANGPYLVAVGQTITLDGSGSSDLDGDPLTFLWSQAETLGTFNDQTLENPEFTGTQAGITDLTLTVNDGYLDGSDTTLIVVYDPDAGFVTGGGWIDSPEGAYYPDTSLTGKANFGFVSKYKKGQSTPTGNTEFKFEIASLDFHSSSYDWLVITGGNKAMYKGTGTINDDGSYKFMITAYDDNHDTFRIKIWEEDEFGDETIIYDNGTDTLLGGGQIKIHNN